LIFYLLRYDHPHILAGQGTIGLEILEQVDDVDAIIVPVGGAGLIAGMAVAIKSLYPRCQIIVSSIFYLPIPFLRASTYVTARSRAIQPKLMVFNFRELNPKCAQVLKQP
jgi:hypothetical protein